MVYFHLCHITFSRLFSFLFCVNLLSRLPLHSEFSGINFLSNLPLYFASIRFLVLRYALNSFYIPLTLHATDVKAFAITQELMSELEHANEQYKFYFCAEEK